MMGVRVPLVALICAPFFALTGFAHDPCEDDASLCGKAAALAGRPDISFDGDDAPQTRENLGDTDVLHCDLEIEVLLPNRLSGHNTMTVRSLIDSLTEFTIRLNPTLSISAVTLNSATEVPPASVQLVGQFGRRVALDR